MRRVPWITLALAGLACFVHGSPALTAALEFHRGAVSENGEAWRLLTAHLAHFDADHLIWDATALLILGTMAERDGRDGFARALALAAVGIGLSVWAWQPALETYRGLSGLDSALFGLVCARLVFLGRRARHAFSIWLGALALAGFALKCGAELATGQTVFATNGALYAPVPLAHLIGLAAGIAAAVWESIKRRPATDAASHPPASGWPSPSPLS